MRLCKRHHEEEAHHKEEMGLSASPPHLQLVLAGVAGQRGVVALNIQLVLLAQAVLVQEAHGCGRIPVVLVLGGLLRAGAEGQGFWEASCTSVVWLAAVTLLPSHAAERQSSKYNHQHAACSRSSAWEQDTLLMHTERY